MLCNKSYALLFIIIVNTLYRQQVGHISIVIFQIGVGVIAFIIVAQ